MTAKSILNMNWTRGTRELETATELTELEAIAVRVSLAYTLQGEHQDEANRRIGNNIEADALHQLLEFCDTNTAHRNKAADVAEQKRQAAEIAADTEWLGEVTALAYGDADMTKLPPAKITTLQELADAKERSFNRRYYNNPNGEPKFVYRSNR